MRPISAPLLWWDRTALLVAVGGLVVLSWVLLIEMSENMMAMEGDMGIKPWASSDFAMMLGMWAVMMVGMMVPTAIRSILIFSQISAKAAAGGHNYVAGYWFTLGYVFAWCGFAAAATLFQWMLDQAALLSPMMVTTSSSLGALILITAGAWQFTPWKDTCLKHCQSPLMFLAANFSPGISGAIQLGVRHGLYCLGCCWFIMGLLFVGGVMNFIWIIAITAFILVEKLLPSGQKWGQVAGGAMIAVGLSYLFLA